MAAYNRARYAVPVPVTVQRQHFETYEVDFDQTKLEIIFERGKVPKDGCPVRRGTWIVITCDDARKGMEYHCRVAETAFFPTISVDQPVLVKKQRDVVADPQTPAATRQVSPVAGAWVPARFQVYEQNFADLDRNDKCVALCRLLDTLPDVTAMRDYLSTRHPADLSNWTARIQPYALSLLRWIIASNRSCIMQVDGDRTDATTASKQDERVYGMKGHMQFRFAMGAPDKEQRFVTEVRETAKRLNLTYPTLFAFHGSPLANWHMIIREGLNFNQADHGRAFGDGVYHSQEALTSSAYSQM